MRTTLFCVAIALACLAGSIRAAEEKGADAVETHVPVAVVADDEPAAVAEIEAALNADVPLVRSKRGLLLLKKLKLAKLGLGLGLAKVAVVGSLLSGAGRGAGGAGGLLGGLGGGLGGGAARPQVSTSVAVQQPRPQPQPQQAIEVHVQQPQVVQQPHAQYGPPAVGASRGGSLTARKEYVVEYVPFQGGAQGGQAQ